MARARIASVEALTNAIMRDRQRERPAPTKTTAECFACGREYLYRDTDGDDSGRFCSTRCREAYDAGFPAHASKGSQHWYSLPVGKHGFLIKCGGCERQFDSGGLRCCSVECERAYRQRQETEALLHQIDMRLPTKRKCAECGGNIPNWRKGRRVSKATRFCSSRCSGKTRRKERQPRLAA